MMSFKRKIKKLFTLKVLKKQREILQLSQSDLEKKKGLLNFNYIILIE